MGLASCAYRGQVRHRRLSPVPHDFRYSIFMMYLDLDEVDRVFDRRWLWSARRPALAWFRRADHFGDSRRPLRDCVADLVAQEAGRRPEGPIRLLTHLRYFGHCFNPVSFYFCYDPAGERIEAVVAEVHNTPWGERHCYVLDPEADCNAGFRANARSDNLRASSGLPELTLRLASSASAWAMLGSSSTARANEVRARSRFPRARWVMPK